MIPVATARTIIDANSKPLPPQTLPLLQASGLVVAAGVYAAADIPQFEQSSMDGYAFQFASKDEPLQIRGEMAAGTTEQLTINGQEAARIFTGAPLPSGADTVVMQEKIMIKEGMLLILDEEMQQGSNVRNRGAEIKKGALAMETGTVLTPAAIGFLAGIGCATVTVYPAPSVSIIITGKELQQPGLPLGKGQVYESNSYSLTTALQAAKISDLKVYYADDDLEVVKAVLDKALTGSNVVLLTGGISVGDYDFVLQAVRDCCVTQLFHKVAQKPGKPLYFGTKEQKLVFGLPGNPSSVLTCFYEYVLPALDGLTRRKNSLKKREAILTKGYKKVPGLTQFLKGTFDGEKVEPLGAQESFRLHSFAQANCLICLEGEKTGYEAGEKVAIHILPV